MFEKLFAFIRSGVKNSILGGIEDANQEIQARLELREEPIAIEDAKPTNRIAQTNGKRKASR